MNENVNVNEITGEVVESFNLATVNQSAPVAAPVHYDDDEKFIANLTTRQVSYCSLVAKTEDEKAALYNAQNNTPKRLKDCINMIIKLKHIYVEVVNLENRETGAIMPAPRIVLIDENMDSYACVSKGIYNAIRKIIGIYGTPDTWKKPLEVMPKLISVSADKNVLTIDIVRKK